MNIAILALDHSAPTGVLVVWDMFSVAASMVNKRRKNAGPKACEIRIVTVDGNTLRYSDFLEIKPHGSIDEVREPDLIIVPSGGYRESRLRRYPERLKTWLATQHHRGVPVAGICTGVFLLAESGILEGRKATTHWAFADVFRRHYPSVDFTPEKIITQDRDIYCSGGGSAGVDLTLLLIERHFGPEPARLLSRMFLLERGRNEQNPYMDSRFEKNHKDPDILKAQAFIETRMTEDIFMDHVASHVGMSLRNFKRRFKAATGESPLAYLQKLRMEKAKLILEHDDVSIDMLARQVGYEDLGFFRKLFARHTGVNPRDYRRRFRNNAA